jgi:hypothetical protein
MTQDEIMKMAKQAGFEGCAELTWEDVICTEELVAFAKLVAQHEREKFCEVLRQLHDSYSLASDSNDIRARGYANDTSSERVDINGERKHDAQHN